MLTASVVSVVLAASSFSPWTECANLAKAPAARLLRVNPKVCERYTFVREQKDDGTARLHPISPESKVHSLERGKLLALLDLDDRVAHLHLLVSAGRPDPLDAAALWMLSTTTNRTRMPALWGNAPVQKLEADVIAGSELLTFAKRLGFLRPEQDGTQLFTGVFVGVSAELNSLLISTALSEQGRQVFKAFRAQGFAGGFDAVLNWRIRHHFGTEMTLVTNGNLCVRPGKMLSGSLTLPPISGQNLPPLRWENLEQLASCPSAGVR
jgi:hypothetical protein